MSYIPGNTSPDTSPDLGLGSESSEGPVSYFDGTISLGSSAVFGEVRCSPVRHFV